MLKLLLLSLRGHMFMQREQSIHVWLHFTESLCEGMTHHLAFKRRIKCQISKCHISALWLWSSWPSLDGGAWVQLMLGISLRACSSSTSLGLPKVWLGPRSANVITTSTAFPRCTVDRAALRGSRPICTLYQQERDPPHLGSLSHRCGHLNIVLSFS